MRGQPPKRKFEFGAWDGLCDVYADGKKVRESHPARHGHIYLHLPPDYPDDLVDVRPFDPRVPVEAVIVCGVVTPTEANEAEQKKQADEAQRQADLKRQAEAKRTQERIIREAAAKKAAEERVAAALAKKAEADKAAADAESDLNMGPDLKME